MGMIGNVLHQYWQDFYPKEGAEWVNIKILPIIEMYNCNNFKWECNKKIKVCRVEMTIGKTHPILMGLVILYQSS